MAFTCTWMYAYSVLHFIDWLAEQGRREDNLLLLDAQASASGVAGVIGQLSWWRSFFIVPGCMFDLSMYWMYIYIYRMQCRLLPSQTLTKLSIFYFSHHQPKSYIYIYVYIIYIYIYISATNNSELHNLISKGVQCYVIFLVMSPAYKIQDACSSLAAKHESDTSVTEHDIWNTILSCTYLKPSIDL